MSLSIENLTPARTIPATAVLATRRFARRVWIVAKAFNRRRALAQLARLDDRLLADLGLARGDLAAAASEPLWSDPTTRLSVLSIERRAAERAHAGWRRSRARAASGDEAGVKPQVCAEG
jgi:uncharacterized protein YjiS (DUF1127 family)